MSRLPDWERDLQQVIQSDGSYTRKRSARILDGPLSNGQAAWRREETRAVDDEGNIHVIDRSWTCHGLCGCVLTQETGQVVCAECGGVVCKEHAIECGHCHRRFCPAHAVLYGRDDRQVTYCQRHRWIHYLKLILGVRE